MKCWLVAKLLLCRGFSRDPVVGRPEQRRDREHGEERREIRGRGQQAKGACVGDERLRDTVLASFIINWRRNGAERTVVAGNFVHACDIMMFMYLSSTDGAVVRGRDVEIYSLSITPVRTCFHSKFDGTLDQ